MSEQNVLNPTQTSLFSPDWGYTEGLQEMRSALQVQSGNIFTRLQQGLGRIYDLSWSGRDVATKLTLQQWENQYRDDYFTLADYEMARDFTGRFDGPLVFSPRGNSQYDVKGRFIELPGKPMFAYPSNWARDAMFMEERNSAGEDLVKLTGTGWAFQVEAASHGGGCYNSAVTNDFAEWIYFGYGFRYWSRQGTDMGIAEVSCTRVRDGAVIVAATNVDLFGVAAVAAVFTQTNSGLDFYRVKLRVTGTKNASSTGFTIKADAIEVMR